MEDIEVRNGDEETIVAAMMRGLMDDIIMRDLTDQDGKVVMKIETTRAIIPAETVMVTWTKIGHGIVLNERIESETEAVAGLGIDRGGLTRKMKSIDGATQSTLERSA